VVPYIVDIKKKREIWEQQRRGNSFSKCANAKPSCIKLRLELCQASIWGQTASWKTWGSSQGTWPDQNCRTFQDYSHACIHLRLYEILITRAFPREFQVAPTLYITPVPCELRLIPVSVKRRQKTVKSHENLVAVTAFATFVREGA